MPIEMPSQPGELLAIQSRAIACRQGPGAGINPRAMRTRMGSGRWQRLQWGVYAVHSGEPARETMLWAALLRAGPGAVLSHMRVDERFLYVTDSGFGTIARFAIPKIEATPRPFRT